MERGRKAKRQRGREAERQRISTQAGLVSSVAADVEYSPRVCEGEKNVFLCVIDYMAMARLRPALPECSLRTVCCQLPVAGCWLLRSTPSSREEAFLGSGSWFWKRS